MAAVPPAGDATFTVGPPYPVTDSRDLPAVNALDEAGFVHGADLPDHPDNVGPEPDDADVDVLADHDDHVEDDLPSDDDLLGLVAEVDADDVDTVGFDAADAAEAEGTGGAQAAPVDGANEPVAVGS